MKASVKLREDEGKPTLLRAKFPVSILSLPFVAALSATPNPRDLSFHLLSSPPSSSSFPSLKLTYIPNPNPNFSLSLRSSLGFPIRFSLHLSPTAPTFSLTFRPSIGDFSFTKKSTSFSLSSSSNPNPKEDPVPSSPMAVKVSTAVPAGNTAGVRVRWAVHLPPESGRLPYLTLDKISIERTEERKDEEGEEKVKKEWGEKDLAAMGGMCFWMRWEVEELRKENASIMEGIESVRVKFPGSVAVSGAHCRTSGGVTAKVDWK